MVIIFLGYKEINLGQNFYGIRDSKTLFSQFLEGKFY